MEYKDMKKIKKENVAINIALCVGSVILFWPNPLAIGACYIGSDILLSSFGLLMEKKFIKNVVKGNTTEEFIESLKENRHKMSGQEFEETDRIIRKLKIEQEKFQSAQEELRKIEENKQKNILIRQISGYESAINVINSFINYYDLTTEESKNPLKIAGLKKLYREFGNLKSNIEAKPNATYLIDGSFYTYTNEMIALLSDYPDITKEKKDEYQVKYEDLLKEFIIYIQKINQKINEYSVSDTDLNLKVLIGELKEVNQTKGES